MGTKPSFALPRLLLLISLLLTLQPIAPLQAQSTAHGTLAARQNPSRSSKMDPSDPTSSLYIIQLKGAPLATAPGLPRQTGKDSDRHAAKPNFSSQAASRRQAILAAQRSRTLASIERQVGQPITPRYIYDTAFNGIAVELTGAQAASLIELPEVLSIEPEQIYELSTDAGPEWIGAGQIWDASATGIYAATILGANQTPPVVSAASGRGSFTFSAATNTLAYTIIISGVSEPITMQHIHRSTDTTVVAPLAESSTAGTYAGSLVLSTADAALLQSDQLYVDFHTVSNPDGSIRGSISGYKGEGVIVGVIDTGINTTHPSFAALGGDGYQHLNPLGQGHYRGACDPDNLPAASEGNPSGYNPAISCNAKLIGAWTFAQTALSGSPASEPSPNDDDGHGSHTASTAAGNLMRNVTIGNATFAQLSGVAPHANIIAYDTCGFFENGFYSGNCPGAALLAAADQAIADGVDVINFSISGGGSPWTDPVEIAFRNARAAGIVVASAAGNGGATPGTVAHVSPWLLAVAGTTHNRIVINKLVNLSADGGASLADITGAGNSSALTVDTPIVYAGHSAIGNSTCGTFSPAQAMLVAGKIVICDRGVVGRIAKAQNIQAAGGVGYVLANDSSTGSSLNGDTYPIPGVHISFTAGTALKSWVAAQASPLARISGSVADRLAANADSMGSFSSRGPAAGVAMGVLKPDLAAPGVDIIAAIANNGSAGADYGPLSGTSMASPHAAGSAALLAGLYPSWTPGQIQSALMTTSLAPLTKEDRITPTTPFDSGAGRIRLERAALAGLVLDETIANFVAANPGTSGDPRTLNLPSMTDPSCVFSCSWSRTVRNTLGVPVLWIATTDSSRIRVTPESFTIAAGGTQTLTITMNVDGITDYTSYRFGRVTLSATGGEAPDAAFPLAARPQISDLPASLIYTAYEGVSSDSFTFKSIAYDGLDIARYGLVKGAPTELSLAEAAIFTTTVVVPVDTARLIADIQSSSAKDIDLFIYRDNGDGVLAGGDALVCASASSSVLEYCNLSLPSAATYIVRVENYSASALGASDPVRLITARVPMTDTGNLVVSGPPASPGGAISLTLGVNEPSSQIGDRWYGWFSLSDQATSTFLDSANFDFRHVLGPASSLTAQGGDSQSAVVGAAFAEPLMVKVTDSANNPIAGAEVAFSAPISGASASLSAASATTNSSGIASLTAIANPQAGSYNIHATALTANGPLILNFSMSNMAGPAQSLTASDGAWSALVGAAFAGPLEVTVQDRYGNPLAGVEVTFSAPLGGASASFSAAQGTALNSATATTDANGKASVTATANLVDGAYTVTASAPSSGGLLTVTFSLTNQPQPQPQPQPLNYPIYLPLIE